MRKRRAGSSVFMLMIAGLAILPSVGLAVTLPGKRVSVVQDNGIWWFRDAKGSRFFSLGACCTGGCCGHWERKPMEPARKQWMLGLLKKWGFNTAAAWSSPSVWSDLYIAEQIYPPFAPKDLDVFDAGDWRKDFVVKGLRAEVADLKGRPNLIGYFIDNEPNWEPGKVYRQYSRLAPDRPGARALVDFTRKFYGGDLKKLNQEWGVNLPGFSDITGRAGRKVPDAPRSEAFLVGWRNEVAGMYYRRYSEMVRQLDPGCLIIGERHAGTPDDGYMKAVASSFDVVSINDYNRYGTLHRDFARIYAATGRPMMITEWSFSGWPRPGLPSLQFIDVYSQENRAKGYRKQVREAAKAPFMVGMHWFLWSDYGPWKEAARAAQSQGSGNEEEQDYYYPDKNMGLVSHDEKEVYDVLVTECARTNAEVDSIHASSSGWKQPPEPGPEKRDASKVALAIDGALNEWPASAAVTPVVNESLDENPPVRHTYYLGWTAEGLAVAGDISDARLDFPDKDWAWEGDYLGVYITFTRTGGGESGSYLQMYPLGDGDDGQQPYAATWWGSGNGEMVKVAKKLKPGGYTMEALIPPLAIPSLPVYKGAQIGVTFGYRDVSGIYETKWAGDVTLK